MDTATQQWTGDRFGVRPACLGLPGTSVTIADLQVRAGELRPLRWEDMDLDHWICHVHRATKRDTGGKIEKSTKTGVTRRCEIEPELRPLLTAMHNESPTKTGRIINLPHECDLSERLVRYLQFAGIKRQELFIEDETRCSITFKDLRATGITWRAIRGDEPLKIQRAAGHKSLNTTQIYIRVAEDLGRGVGRPFPPLPGRVIGRAGAALAQNLAHRNLSIRNHTRNVRPQRDSNSERPDDSSAISTGLGQPRPANGHEEPHPQSDLGQPHDPVESALASALEEASRDRRWDVVALLAKELEARRVARTATNVLPFVAPAQRGGQ